VVEVVDVDIVVVVVATGSNGSILKAYLESQNDRKLYNTSTRFK
jgi:hypothetical protein